MLPRGSRQLCIRKSPVQCCLNTLGITLHSWKPYYTMLPEKLQTTLNKKKSCAIFSLYSRNNIAQVKNLCNVVRKAPDNISWEKILCNIVLILLGQHCTTENPIQCCPTPKGSRQLCMSKIQCFIHC